MGYRIYAVDDEQALRDLYAMALGMSGMECETFADGQALFAALASQTPDLILLDIMLPGMSGLEILERLKSSPAYQNIPVIIVSAKGSEMDKVTGLNSGADDYLEKPFGVMELTARIKANIRKKAPAPAFVYKDLSWNRDAREISLGGAPISLTLTEYLLLSYFLEHVGIALTKETLLHDVWGISCDVETRTLDIHISKLRKKIQGSQASIQTIRGVGFRLQ